MSFVQDPKCTENNTRSCSLPSQLHYHVRVDFLFAVDVGCGPSELQQLVRLVHHQGGVELAQPEQVAAEHPAETVRGVERVRS